MPRLIANKSPVRTPTVEFVFSPAMDMMNAMYFTHLARDSEGMDAWPVQLRRDMDPDLLAELDYLFTFPNDQPGALGQFTDSLFAHPEAWTNVDTLIEHLRRIPAGMGDSVYESGIQGLAVYLCCYRDEPNPPLSDDPREALRLKLIQDGVTDVDEKMAVWDKPEELRERMINLVRAFYEKHYKDELPRRRPLLERGVAAHKNVSLAEAISTMQKITGRPTMCFEEGGVCYGPQDSYLFQPSLDMGPYASCAVFELPRPMHAMFYPLEAEFQTLEGTPEANEIQRSARLYKALSDEQRLRILQLLGNGEMYAQEIVDRIGLHQSVVSRHLSLLRAVGVLRIRKQNNMKFYSLNPAITEDLTRPLAIFALPEAEDGDTK